MPLMVQLAGRPTCCQGWLEPQRVAEERRRGKPLITSSNGGIESLLRCSVVFCGSIRSSDRWSWLGRGSRDYNEPVSVTEIFHTMDWGPAPESSGPAMDWLTEHDGKFGLFIGGE